MKWPVQRSESLGGQICLGTRKTIESDMLRTVKSDTTRERPNVGAGCERVELPAEFGDEMRVDGF